MQLKTGKRFLTRTDPIQIQTARVPHFIWLQNTFAIEKFQGTLNTILIYEAKKKDDE
jgi:hypothetical protein